MGVSLERVQFKFASIIGELCSDPDVLSQFAVWLDLRLAEYKLKGAISLECSGEEPDPIWLKGLNKGRRRISSAENVTHPRFERRGQRRLSGDSSSRSTQRAYDPAPSSLSQGNLGFQTHDVSLDAGLPTSPDIVVIKEESSGVFPVSLHSHINTNSNTPDHKPTPALDVYSSNTDHWSQDSYGQSSKRRRTAESVDSPSNQSLMSVLGVTDSSETVTRAMNDTSVVPSASSDNVTSAVASTSSVNHLKADVSADFTDSSQNNSQCFQDMSWLNNSAMSADNNDSSASANASSISEAVVTKILPAIHRRPDTCTLTVSRGQANQNRKSKISRERLAVIPRQTLTSMAAAVGTFERWLWQKYTEEKREITDITPVELDKYLAEFFNEIRTPSGADYKLESFVRLKSYLGRYLKETQYPELLSGSPVFQTSQAAFRARKFLLH